MEEIFKDIVGYEGFYQVSNIGRVKSLSRTHRRGNGYYNKPDKIRRLNNNRGTPYKIITLKINQKQENWLVHRLVAIHFIPNPDNKSCVNHIDGNPSNNHVSNLEWCTHKENMYHAIYVLKLDNFFKGGHEAKLTVDQVLEIRSRKEENPKLSFASLGRDYGVGHKAIENIIKRKNWKHVN